MSIGNEDFPKSYFSVQYLIFNIKYPKKEARPFFRAGFGLNLGKNNIAVLSPSKKLSTKE